MERRKPFMQTVAPGGPSTIFEIKVMLCYLLDSLKGPISAENLLYIMQSEQLVNYFEYVSAMGELCDQGHVKNFFDENGEEFYEITPECAALVVDLESSLAMTLRERVVKAAARVLTFKQNAKENRAEIIKTDDDDGYIVSLEVPDKPHSLCKMELYMPSRSQAELLRDGFLQDPTLLYATVLSALTGDITTLVTALQRR